jgi:hypothetical protein
MTPRTKYVALGAAALVVTAGAATVAGRGDDPAVRHGEVGSSVGSTPRQQTVQAQQERPQRGQQERPYQLTPTRRCLETAGFRVAKIRSEDARLRALGDLAQRTSLAVRRDGRTLGLAIGDAELLESLLRVPGDPYRLEVRRNALLMYRPSDRRQAVSAARCLRS